MINRSYSPNYTKLNEGNVLTMHSTHFIFIYMVLDIIIVNDHSDNERKTDFMDYSF